MHEKDAITVLNTLQTPHKVLEERSKAGFKISNEENDHLRQCLARVGHSVGLGKFASQAASNIPLAK
jgi:hypothetical protein